MMLGRWPNDARLRRMMFGLGPNDAAPAGQLRSPCGTIKNITANCNTSQFTVCFSRNVKKPLPIGQRLLMCELCM